MSDEKEFELGDILSVTTGCLVSRDGMGGIFTVLNFLTGDNLYTHQLPRAMDETKPHVLAQHPDLTGVDGPDLTGVADGDRHDAVFDWLAEQEERFGRARTLTPLAAEDHTHIDPLSELGLLGVKPENTFVAPAPSHPQNQQ